MLPNLTSIGFTNFFRCLIFDLSFFRNADVVTIKDEVSKENSWNICRSYYFHLFHYIGRCLIFEFFFFTNDDVATIKDDRETNGGKIKKQDSAQVCMQSSQCASTSKILTFFFCLLCNFFLSFAVLTSSDFTDYFLQIWQSKSLLLRHRQ